MRECRAERDLWSLLSILKENNLFGLDSRLIDKSDEEFVREYEYKELKEKDMEFSDIWDMLLKDKTNVRILKGFLLKTWLEFAAQDLTVTTPSMNEKPWSATLKKQREYFLSGGASGAGPSVRYMHPDAQVVGTEGAGRKTLLSLEGVDAFDQVELLRCIWELIRCGDLKRAQEVAFEHQVFWLHSALAGVAEYYYENEENQDEAEEEWQWARVGNVRTPLWHRICRRFVIFTLVDFFLVVFGND